MVTGRCPPGQPLSSYLLPDDVSDVARVSEPSRSTFCPVAVSLWGWDTLCLVDTGRAIAPYIIVASPVPVCIPVCIPGYEDKHGNCNGCESGYRYPTQCCRGGPLPGAYGPGRQTHPAGGRGPRSAAPHHVISDMTRHLNTTPSV